jgi:hypothetical protein
MNERIKLLAEQVGAVQNVLAMGRHDGVLFTETELEKFAELIVKECAVVAHNTAEGETTYGWMVGNKIKEHFGVEE